MGINQAMLDRNPLLSNLIDIHYKNHLKAKDLSHIKNQNFLENHKLIMSTMSHHRIQYYKIWIALVEYTMN